MFRKVKLYGGLAKFVGHKEFEVKAETVAKAVSFLVHNFPGIESYMGPKYYHCLLYTSPSPRDED